MTLPTEIIQWVNEQAQNYRDVDLARYNERVKQAGFTDHASGLTKGIEEMMKFTEWVGLNYWLTDGGWNNDNDIEDAKFYTTSELLLIYLKTIEK